MIVDDEHPDRIGNTPGIICLTDDSRISAHAAPPASSQPRPGTSLAPLSWIKLWPTGPRHANPGRGCAARR
jgi:hypothetical protein